MHNAAITIMPSTAHGRYASLHSVSSSAHSESSSSTTHEAHPPQQHHLHLNRSLSPFDSDGEGEGEGVEEDEESGDEEHGLLPLDGPQAAAYHEPSATPPSAAAVSSPPLSSMSPSSPTVPLSASARLAAARRTTHLSDVVAWKQLSFQYALAYGVDPGPNAASNASATAAAASSNAVGSSSSSSSASSSPSHMLSPQPSSFSSVSSSTSLSSTSSPPPTLRPIAIYDKTFREPRWRSSAKSFKEKVSLGIRTKEGIHESHIASTRKTIHTIGDFLTFLFREKEMQGIETIMMKDTFFADQKKHGWIFYDDIIPICPLSAERPKCVHFLDIDWIAMQRHKSVLRFFRKYVPQDVRAVIIEHHQMQQRKQEEKRRAALAVASPAAASYAAVAAGKATTLEEAAVSYAAVVAASTDAATHNSSSAFAASLAPHATAAPHATFTPILPYSSFTSASSTSISFSAAPLLAAGSSNSSSSSSSTNNNTAASTFHPFTPLKYLTSLQFTLHTHPVKHTHHYELTLPRARPVKIIDLAYPESSLNLATVRAVSTNIVKGALSAIPFFGPPQVVNMALERIFDFTDVLHLQHQAEALNLLIEALNGHTGSPFHHHPEITQEIIHTSIFYILRSNIMLSSIIKNALTKNDQLVTKYLEDLRLKRDSSIKYLQSRHGVDRLDLLPLSNTFFALGVQRDHKTGEISKMKLYVLVFTKLGRKAKPHAAVDFHSPDRERRKREILQQLLTASNMFYVPVPGIGGVVKMVYKEVIIREVHKRQMWEHGLLAHIRHNRGELAHLIQHKLDVNHAIAAKYENYAVKQLEERALSPLDLSSVEADIHRKNVEQWMHDVYPTKEQWTPHTYIPFRSQLSQSAPNDSMLSASSQGEEKSEFVMTPLTPQHANGHAGSPLSSSGHTNETDEVSRTPLESISIHSSKFEVLSMEDSKTTTRLGAYADRHRLRVPTASNGSSSSSLLSPFSPDSSASPLSAASPPSTGSPITPAALFYKRVNGPPQDDSVV